jgi:hypothetical protein
MRKRPKEELNFCGEPAISLHSHHVQWTTRLLTVTRDPGSKPLRGLTVCDTGILLLALSRYTSYILEFLTYTLQNK